MCLSTSLDRLEFKNPLKISVIYNIGILGCWIINTDFWDFKECNAKNHLADSVNEKKNSRQGYE